VLEEAPGSRGILPILDQDVEHDAVLVDGSPKMVDFAIDLQERLIQAPGISWLRPASP
jgi:hypothetical protein